LGRTGFTLIELTVVAFIFTLFAALASTGFRRSFDTIREEAAMRDVCSLLALSNERAVLEKANYGVRFAPDKNAYWLMLDGQEDPSRSRIRGRWSQTRWLPSSFALSGAETTAAFYPDGTAAPVEIEFTAHGRRRILKVDPLTARASFDERA